MEAVGSAGGIPLSLPLEQRLLWPPDVLEHHLPAVGAGDRADRPAGVRQEAELRIVADVPAVGDVNVERRGRRPGARLPGGLDGCPVFARPIRAAPDASPHVLGVLGKRHDAPTDRRGHGHVVLADGAAFGVDDQRLDRHARLACPIDRPDDRQRGDDGVAARQAQPERQLGPLGRLLRPHGQAEVHLREVPAVALAAVELPQVHAYRSRPASPGRGVQRRPRSALDGHEKLPRRRRTRHAQLHRRMPAEVELQRRKRDVIHAPLRVLLDEAGEPVVHVVDFPRGRRVPA